MCGVGCGVVWYGVVWCVVRGGVVWCGVAVLVGECWCGLVCSTLAGSVAVLLGVERWRVM